MEVVIPTRPTMDFDFNSARSSPCITAPSTPRRFGDYNFLSAPTSPSHISEFYKEFDDFNTISNWEDVDEHDFASKSKSPKSSIKPKFEDDFAFDVSEEVERTSLSAEELFDGGVLRPYTPPPPPQVGPKVAKPTAPRSASFLRQVLSPRRNKRDKDNHSFGSSSTRIETTRNTRNVSGADHQTRGRDRAPQTLSSSISGRRTARSLSPLKVSQYQWEEDEKIQQQQEVSERQNNKQLASKASGPLSVTTACNPTSSKASSRKWRLRDFLLFRSKSEGRATDMDPFRKYATMFRKSEEMKNECSSLRSTYSPASGSSSERRGSVSAHELHYTVNKAVSEDMKKKTFLPYKQGILGRLAFNPAVSALANGFGSLSRSS